MRGPGLSRTRRAPLIAGLVALGTVITLLAVWASAALAPRFAASLAAVQVGPVAYAFAPDPLRLPANAAVSLSFANHSDAPHTFVLLAPIGTRTSAAVDPGATARLEFVTPDSGTYGFVCNVHEDMAGTLVVE